MEVSGWVGGEEQIKLMKNLLKGRFSVERARS